MTSIYETEADRLEQAAERGEITLRLRGVRMRGVDYDHDTEGRPIYNAFDAILGDTSIHTWANSEGLTVHYTEDYPGGPITGHIQPADEVLAEQARARAAELREQGAEFTKGDDDDAA